MLPKRNLIQYLAAYQQQLLARSGIIIRPPKIPSATPTPVESVSDRQKCYWAACRNTNKQIYRNGIPKAVNIRAHKKVLTKTTAVYGLTNCTHIALHVLLMAGIEWNFLPELPYIPTFLVWKFGVENF
ncbi:hypothetical protein B9Z55_025395 [Caenorhabditis nigoni]|uniref:Uncharacterized protein n=1 Tax=Caenorhabditis nigoni TaxID=1611254 RepID=A0A2G5SYU9_9PELO|nr:hypothetical protein B9Z55_025395 [Caenorhabditis nigoni]